MAYVNTRTQQKEAPKNNAPSMKYRSGALQGTVWTNKGKTQDGRDYAFNTYTVERNYMDANKQWQKTTSLRLNDLWRARLIIDQMMTDSMNEKDTENEQA